MPAVRQPSDRLLAVSQTVVQFSVCETASGDGGRRNPRGELVLFLESVRDPVPMTRRRDGRLVIGPVAGVMSNFRNQPLLPGGQTTLG